MRQAHEKYNSNKPRAVSPFRICAASWPMIESPYKGGSASSKTSWEARSIPGPFHISR
jgi:hypothetical protein